jgi:hypothetical protein
MKIFLPYLNTFFTIIILPVVVLSQSAPNLNTAAGYVLFTGNGEFTSTSTSTNVTGDVGNLVGPVSAFPPGNLTGTKHFGDAAATQADADITAAYADLAGRTCGTVHGVGFGVGETLTPGVYCATANSTLNGDLTLDAGGNAAAVFIIKIDGAFSAASGSQIILINQASACNVYWQINGAVDLNNSVFKGTMLVNGAISLNTGTNLEGRALTKTGALIFQAINATVCNFSALPLKLEKFDVNKITGDNVQLSWMTTSEINMLRYDIEASNNGTAFYKLGAVVSKGNNFPTQYTFQDIQVKNTGIRSYRLKMVDNAGLFSYSDVKSVKFSDLKFGLINIFPNPAVNSIKITVNAEIQENVTLTITNMHGQKMRQKTMMVNKGINNFEEDIRNLSTTSYIISIKNITTGKVSRQNFQKL